MIYVLAGICNLRETLPHHYDDDDRSGASADTENVKRGCSTK